MPNFFSAKSFQQLLINFVKNLCLGCKKREKNDPETRAKWDRK
jgi:hypothetical protein